MIRILIYNWERWSAALKICVYLRLLADGVTADVTRTLDKKSQHLTYLKADNAQNAVEINSFQAK